MSPKNKNEAPATPGVLYVAATPIGNMDDITLRALKILREVDMVAAEDTRLTGRLLDHHGLKKKLISFQEHNEKRRVPMLMAALRDGASIALVSDAGTPTVSDPGHRLVKAAAEDGFTVTPIPGASALLAALCAAGLPTDTFIFVGFLPKKKG
ncbi:MAG: 16S rRNA (cytidine(1402)-2'-O)-methyltransferase, partial [Desulfobacterales bacterium]|nr:16S rRNA (cytidine(1402)-2'-O)-methyltransferase [Desulfobacterales bacterium]